MMNSTFRRLALVILAMGIVASLGALSYRYVLQRRALDMLSIALETSSVQLDDLHRSAHALDLRNQAKQHVIDSLATSAHAWHARADSEAVTTDSLRSELGALPTPSVADSTDPAWMHRATLAEHIVTLDDARLTSMDGALRSDSLQLVLYRGMIAPLTMQRDSALTVADSLRSVARGFQAVKVTENGCGLPRFVPCPTRKVALVVGLASGTVLASLHARKQVARAVRGALTLHF